MKLDQLKPHLDLVRFNKCKTTEDYESLVEKAAGKKTLSTSNLGFLVFNLKQDATKLDFRRLKAISLCTSQEKVQKLADELLMKRSLCKEKWNLFQSRSDLRDAFSLPRRLSYKVIDCKNAKEAKALVFLPSTKKKCEILFEFLKSQNALSKKRRWSKEELKKMQTCKHFKEAEKLARSLDRTPTSCTNKFQHLVKQGFLKKSPLKKIDSWSNVELTRLEKHKSVLSAQRDQRLNKNRSLLAIETMWYQKVSPNGQMKKIYHPWTNEENTLLESCKTLKVLQSRFASFDPHTPAATKAQWYKIKGRSF